MANEPTGFKEKRASLRVDMEAEPVRLHWIDDQGQAIEDDATCLDLARKGVLFEYKQAFKVGALVALTFNQGTPQQNTIKGQVCRCSAADENSFHIAMQLV
ncbi:PilZ domain-containing protein [Shewanella maritima]|uniref:PilZ domain-containing protein n=1 Tax=Shewanella maritima TaxID=2520507 RepID=A0A411PLK6_9GAMM|nr:PilZ domain-containing protein [Shewanella maritima]QBF84395.1 PilZ domain-containing protein [Shewanella maritima]